MSEVKEWQLPVITALIKKCKTREKTVAFCNLLKDTGSLLSGGFILKAILKYDETIPDLDIYVPYNKVPDFLKRCVLDKLFKFEYFKHHNASIYCRSFLRKNGIRRIHTFNGKNIDIDIMSVRARTTPTKVCSNFDLTFCQVWFDGVNVYATHPDHIKNKKGYLQMDYINTFMKGNRFLRNRLKKYKNRGFNIEYDPEYNEDTSISSIDSILNRIGCTREQRDETMLDTWMKRALLKYFLVKKDIHSFSLPLTLVGVSTTYPVNEDITFKARKEDVISKFSINDDDGYDSEDLEQSDFIELANKQIISDIPPELKYGRQIFTLLHNSVTLKDTYNFSKILDGNNIIIEESKNRLKRIGNDIKGRDELNRTISFYTNKNTLLRLYIKHIHTYTRIGGDMFGDDGNLYDFHEHSVDEAITRDSMETYLNDYINTLSDEEKLKGVRCYMGDLCKKITLTEIKSIVSDTYYEKFTKQQPVKTGLNIVVPIYNSLLPNTKKTNEKYGDVYNETLCPFCLEPVSRYEGCSYMTHKKVEGRESPYCRNELIVLPVFNKYKKIAKALSQPEVPLYLQFCIECGRPCLSHQHIDITSSKPTLIEQTKIPNRNNPGQMTFDYAKCDGGGRVELIARILAIRKVYKTSRLKDPHKEREMAAIKADKAANSKKYLKKAREIFKEESNTRSFKNKMPDRKKYNDPAYKNDENEKEENTTNNEKEENTTNNEKEENTTNNEKEENTTNNEKEEKEEKENEENENESNNEPGSPYRYTNTNSSNESNIESEENETQIPYQNESELNERDMNEIVFGRREGGREGGRKGGQKTNKHMFKYIRKLNKTCKLRKRK